MMNRTQLIKKIFELYPNSFSDNAKIWREAYEEVIPETLIDYKKLYKMMLNEYHSQGYAPPTAFFAERIKTVEIKPEPEAVEEDKDLIPMPDWFKSQKTDLLRKVGIKKEPCG